MLSFNIFIAVRPHPIFQSGFIISILWVSKLKLGRSVRGNTSTALLGFETKSVYLEKVFFPLL